MRRITTYGACAAVAVISLIAGCPSAPVGDTANPFRDVPPIAIDGQEVTLMSTVVPLGELDVGDVIRVLVSGTKIDAVLILKDDVALEEAAVVVGGGLPEQPIDYRIALAGRYFVFVQFDPASSDTERGGTITVSPGDPNFAPPSMQIVRIVFENGFLTEPGLFDPDSNTAEDKQFLESISGVVRDGVLDRLRTIFADTPIVIVGDEEPLPTGLFSTITLSPERVEVTEFTQTDVTAPDPRFTIDPACNATVLFGTVLPSGNLDPGNQIPDDDGIVYVGSFQGRGAACQSAAINSVNNIVLGLAQTAAHEIGHLVGLFHVPLTDIMDRSPSQAFQRELGFQRGQLLVDAFDVDAEGNPVPVPIVLPTVIQDTQIYFVANFGP